MLEQESSDLSVEHRTMPIAVKHRSFNEVIACKQTNLKVASVVDINEMAEKQLPVRSTSQMENMVNLGGGYELGSDL